MTPAQTWLLIALGVPAVLLAAWWFIWWLEGSDPRPMDMAVMREQCECGRFLFLCDDHGHDHRHEHRDGGTVHRPDLCQPADEAL